MVNIPYRIIYGLPDEGSLAYSLSICPSPGQQLVYMVLNANRAGVGIGGLTITCVISRTIYGNAIEFFNVSTGDWEAVSVDNAMGDSEGLGLLDTGAYLISGITGMVPINGYYTIIVKNGGVPVLNKLIDSNVLTRNSLIQEAVDSNAIKLDVMGVTVQTIQTDTAASFAKARTRLSTMRVHQAEIGVHRIAAARSDDGSYLSTSSFIARIIRMSDNYMWNGSAWQAGAALITPPEFIPPTPPGPQGIHYADVNFSLVGFYYVKFAVLAASPASGYLEEGEIWEIVAPDAKAGGTKGADAIYDKVVAAAAAKILVQNAPMVAGKAYYYSATIVDYLGKPIVPDAAPQLYCFKNNSTVAQFQATMKKRGSDGGRFYMDKVVDATYEMGAQYLFVTKATVGGVTIESSETIRFEDTKKIDYIYSKETRR